MIAITGNTYPVKDALKALGGKWNPDQKAWMVPDEKVNEANKIVSAGTPAVERKSSQSYRPRVCRMCGVAAKSGYGRYNQGAVVIYQSGECRDCYEERKMGY